MNTRRAYDWAVFAAVVVMLAFTLGLFGLFLTIIELWRMLT